MSEVTEYTVIQFDRRDIQNLGDDDEATHPWWFEAAMVSTCRPIFDDCDSNYGVMEKLTVAGVISKYDKQDSETCSLVVYFTDAAMGEAFIERLNNYLRVKAKAMREAREM
jgi:hypothetical protein